jgi:CRISPR-associated endonuclease Csn1
MKNILSLDLGITSVGYSILKQLDTDKYSLVDYGVSMFDKPYDEKNNSKKILHSEVTSFKKLNDLKKERKRNLALLFEEFGLGDKDYFLYQEKQNVYKNKWHIRAKKAFCERLKVEELFTILYSIAKRRGYKSLETSDLLEELCKELEIPFEEDKKTKNNEEKGKIKSALKRVEELKERYPQKTVAAIIYEEELKNPTPVFRNHDNYRYMIRREDINDEIKKIVLAQKEFGLFDKDFDVDKFIKRLIKTIDDQKESTNNKDLLANCEFYKEHKVAHQYSLITDIFKMYQAVSNITFNSKPEIKITKEQIKLIADDFFKKVRKGKKIDSIKFKDVRKILNLPDDIKIFNKEDFSVKNGKKQDNYIIKFHFVNNLSKIDNTFILKAFEKENPYEELKEIFDTLGFEKSPKIIYENLKNKIDNKTIVELIKNKTGSSTRISSYAMVKFIPYFEQGYTLDDIKKELGLIRNEDYSKFQKGIKYLSVSQFENDDSLLINNHPVKSIVSAALRVTKHLHVKHGPFDEIKVESARELSQNEETRKAIDKANKELEKQIDNIMENEEYQEIAQRYGRNLRKYARKILMWLEQDKLDIYTGKNIGISEIFSNTVDIDHIVPQSLGGLSVKHNLVLTHKDSNLKKSNQLPINFVEDKNAFENRVEHLFRERKINWKKKVNLLATTFDETFKDTFESKELRATSYVEALTAQVLKRYYPFPNEKKQKDGSAVRHIQGRATSNIRKLLHVKTKVRDTNIHHAVDAILIGLTNQSWLQKLSNTFRENFGKIDDEARANIKKATPLIDGIEPSELIGMIEKGYNKFGKESVFYEDIWGKTKTVYFWVSKKPMVSKIHKDTIYAKKENGIYTVREKIIDKFVSLKVSSKTKVDEFYKKFKKEILYKMYLHEINQNDVIYKTVQKRGDEIAEMLKSFERLDANDKEALAEAKDELNNLIHKPLIDNNGNEIRRVQFYQTNLTGFEIRGGLATKAKTFIGFKAKLKDGKFKYERIDMSNIQRIKKKKDTGFKVYKNDVVFFTYPDGSCKGGRIVSFLDEKNLVAFSNPRFPGSIAYQPEEFLTFFNGKPNSHKQHSIKKAIGIIKLNLDITGNIKSYRTIGSCESEFLEFLKSIKS